MLSTATFFFFWGGGRGGSSLPLDRTLLRPNMHNTSPIDHMGPSKESASVKAPQSGVADPLLPSGKLGK